MLEEAPHAAALLQIQNRLLAIAHQVDQIQGQMVPLVAETRAGAEQVDILTRHLTSTQPLHGVHEQLAALSTQLATNQEQVEQLAQSLRGVVRREQFDALAQALARTASHEQVNRLFALVAPREELTALTEFVAQLAPREQIEQLLQTVANQEQVGQLEETFKRLSRTQFKANSLSESKEQQVESALATLQDLATRRAKLEEAQAQRTTQQLDTVRRVARGELAAELLPALDSLELALEHGAALLQRQRAQIDELSAQHQRYLTQMQTHLEEQERQLQHGQQTQSASSPRLWRRLFGVKNTDTVVATPPLLPPPPLLPDPVPADALLEPQLQAQTALQSWLHGLELVRDRFVALLATEEVQMIDALHKPFDPRLHVAVDTMTRSDVEPNRVVAVLRKGYRQRERILRYAEVVVARQPVAETDSGIETGTETDTVTETKIGPSTATLNEEEL